MTQARGVSRDTKRQRGSALPVVDVTPSPGVPPMPPLVGGAPVEAVAVPPVHAPPTGLALADKMVKDLEAALARKVDAAIGSKASARELIQLHRYWSEIRAAGTLLDPEVLTIGFARRFATYKRASLIMRDRARLARIVNNPERPVVFLFAGKAHPADQPGDLGRAFAKGDLVLAIRVAQLCGQQRAVDHNPLGKPGRRDPEAC